MVMAAELSMRLGLVDVTYVQRLRRVVQAAGLPVQAPVLQAGGNVARYLELMRVDKKAEAGQIRFVVVDASGHARMQSAPDDMVADVIDACCRG
jgi:3-dehydroquinate synthase